jgi:AraC-like DNA-binding protein
MIYKFFHPSPPLKAYVKEYLLLHFNFTGLSVKPTRFYTPQPEQCLTFDPRGLITAVNRQTGKVQRRSSSYLSGQQVSCYDLHFDQDYLMLKVVFQPGALFRLLDIPLAEFGSLYVDAESVLNKEMRSINEQLANAENYTKMIQIVEGYLLHKVKNIKKSIQPIDMIGEILNKQPDQFSLQWFASQACLSPRQFERKFIERIGISPKLYYRIARFHKAFEMKEKNPGSDWLSVAVACGYTDFQHLNKDFKQFADVTPTILLKDQAQVTEKILNLI